MDMEKYANQVVKYLKCPGSKKREIKRQILSDMQAALEAGSSPEQVIRDMGEPRALAMEFNESFSEADRKAAGRARACKVLAIVLAVLAAAAGLVWWILPKAKYLSDSRIFSEEQVMERAEQVVDLFNKEDYEGLRPYLSHEMEEFMSENSIGEIKQYIGSDWGEMRNVGNVYLLEYSQMWQKYAMVQMTVSYENVGVTYTMNFDRDLKLAGFFVK